VNLGHWISSLYAFDIFSCPVKHLGGSVLVNGVACAGWLVQSLFLGWFRFGATRFVSTGICFCFFLALLAHGSHKVAAEQPRVGNKEARISESRRDLSGVLQYHSRSTSKYVTIKEEAADDGLVALAHTLEQ